MEKVLKYTEKEVNFDSVKIPQILYEHGPLGRKGKIEYNDDEVTHIDDKPFINAVDIDWNGIEVENNNRINTTADLINWIKSRSTGSSGGILPVTISLPITCYRWYHKDDLPIVPTENSEEPTKNDTYEAIPESKWSKYAINRPEGNNWVLYLCSGTKEGKSYFWQSVTRISGVDGSVGEDSKDREWIYKVFNEELNFSSNSSNPANWNAVQQDDYVGPNGWSDNPQGVSKENRFEYASYRDFKNKLWTKFSTPILWSHYGINGIDGDGVEYCYVRTTHKVAPEVANTNEDLQVDDFLPWVKIEETDKHEIKGTGNSELRDDGFLYAKCTDDPKGVDGTFQYEWVIVRKKDKPDDNGIRKWKNYSGQMSLWSSFTINVNPAITIKDGYLWGDGDYIKDGDGNPIRIEGGDGSQGVETIGCPDENKTYKPGTISVCENKVKIYYNNQWIDFGEGSGSGKYIHIAYAKTIDFVNKKYTGFSTTNSNDGTIYDWMGIMFDDKIDDTNIDSDNTNDPDGILWDTFKQYKWNYIKGRDGNGVEYVFLLTKEEVTKPGIDENPYVDNEGVSHNKQDDEFLPLVTNYDLLKYQSHTWTDDPRQGVSEEWPKLWKAIRKKVNGVWQSFGPPKIENQYFAQTSIYVITSDNDNILLDDLSTDRDIISVAAAGNLELKYGTQTIDDAWYEVVDHNLPNKLVPKIINRNSFNLQYESGTTIPGKFNTGQYHFTIRAKLTANDSSYVALKQFNVIIKDISVDGSFYKLVIKNDSLSYDGNKNSYNNNAPIIHVLKIGIKDNKISISEETNISITTEIIDPENPGNLSNGLVLYIPESLFTVESSKKYDSPIELNNVTYQKGGYDIVLYYYNGKKLELLGAEHIDCVKDGKDGKDASISDGITIDHIDRYYQATNTNNTYPNSHKGHENENDGADGWWRMQSDAGWSASNPYLFIQDHTFYNNDTNSWGKVELYSYWGNENYDLVVSPLHIILDENVDEENGNRSYSGTNTVTVTLYKSGKSGTENSIIPTILQCKFYFIKDSNPYNLTQIERNINTKTTTITINTNKSNGSSMYSIEEYLSDKDNSISEGYLSFTVVGYENGKLIFTREVKVPVYINRAESTLFKVKGELESYIEDQGYITETRYTADISATQKTLRSEYTEKIKYAKDRGRNLFGFNKGIYWHQDTTLSPVIPFIQGYGIVVKNSGAISNIGIEKLTEDTETESFGNYTVSFSAKTNENKGGSYHFLFCGRNAKTATVNKIIQSNPENPITIYDDEWVDITLSFNLNDISDEKLYGLGFMRKTYDSYAYLYVRHLKIELGSVATDFCEADEDIMNLGKNQMITALTNNGMKEETFEVETDNFQKGYSKYVNTSSLSSYPGYYIDLLNQDNAFSLQAGKTYTLSFWAKCSTAGMIIKSYLYGSSIITISWDVEIYDNGEIFEGIQIDGETKVRLSSDWKHYFIHLYAGNTVSSQSLIALRVSKDDNLISGSTYRSGTIYMAGIVLQEGYVIGNETFSSLIEQNARRISMYQTTGLTKAGIDIYNGKVDIQADQFTIRNSSGQKNMSVNETGDIEFRGAINVLADNFTITNNNGDVNMSVNETGDVEFRGVIKGTYGYNIQMYNPKATTKDNYIKSDTDYYLFGQEGTSSSKYTLYLPEASMCPGRRIEIVNSFLASDASYVQLCAFPYDNNLQLYAPIAAFTSEETMITRYDIGDKRKIIVWADPSLISKGSGQGWRILEIDKHLGYDYLISDEATRALTYNLNKPEVISALVSVLKNRL